MLKCQLTCCPTGSSPTPSTPDEPLTNAKLWDQVLEKQPGNGDKKNGDVLYEYPRKVRRVREAASWWISCGLIDVTVDNE